MLRGHVFLIMGDLLHLACDAWMLSTSRSVQLSSWRGQLIDADARLAASDLGDLRAGRALAAPLQTPAEEPQVILTTAVHDLIRDPSEIRDSVREFVRVALGTIRTRSTLAGRRPLPLLALPFFGTAKQGGSGSKGEILTHLLDEAMRCADEDAVDIVIVFRDANAYSLSQEIRKQKFDAWPALTAQQRQQARELAEVARHGRLVPFMGAGVSVSAGAPTWAELLQALAQGVRLDESLQQLLFERNPLDQAAFLRIAYRTEYGSDEGDARFAAAIADAVSLPRYGLAPALLAALDSEQAITLNYDELFELASADAGRPRSVISQPGDAREHWLLKLHGTITDTTSIVLTREDYLGFNAERAALSAVAKATLLTRHLLFVGFGLQDDHFHEIAYDVRRALEGRGSSSRIGTVLTLGDDPLDRRIWGKELDFVAMEGRNLAEQARQLEMFLDFVMALASQTHGYLLADGFADALDDAEATLGRRLRDLGDAMGEKEMASPAGQVVVKALRELGYAGDHAAARSASTTGRR